MKATRHTIPSLIEKREPFSNTSGTVVAVKNPKTFPVGQLNEDEKSRLRIDARENGIAYIVFSYGTPIAWETKNGHVYKVQQRFTQTTSKHQGLLYLFHERHAG